MAQYWIPPPAMATGHPTNDDLELYALDCLGGADAAPVEHHPLVCEECRERLAGSAGPLGRAQTN